MIDGKSVRQKLIGSDDERAVSPVIGVILMVAITVILAAVIAAFVLDMGPGNQALSASAEVEGDGTDTVTVELTGGGDNVDGIAFVDDSGDVDHTDTDVSKTGATGSYSAGTDDLTDEEYTIYAYQGTEPTNSIDDADANVELGTAEITASSP